MRPKLFILFYFLTSFSFAQQPLTKAQINRLADAGKLYGYVKYFHPFLQYKNFNWNSDFERGVEDIMSAKNTDEYCFVIKKLLSSLDDGITTTWNTSSNGIDYKAQDIAYHIKDSILYLQMNDAPYMTTDTNFQNALQNLNYVKGAVIDMRRPFDSRYHENLFPTRAFFDGNTSWFKGTYLMPSERTVSHSGFPGDDFTDYTQALIKPGLSVTGTLTKEVPLIFIVSNEDEIPIVAVKLQKQGKAELFQQGDQQLLPGSSLYFYLDSLFVQMRTSELLNDDGSLFKIYPNLTFPSNLGKEEITAKATQVLQDEQFQSAPFPSTHTTFAGHIDSFPNELYPSIGYRMLAAAKMFSIIDHFYASRSSMPKNWEEAYKKAIQKFIEAKDSVEYWRAVSEFHAVIQDSHGWVSNNNEWFSLRLAPIIQNRGNYEPPVFTHLIENKIVITDVLDDSLCNEIGIKRGDVILSINNRDPIEMMNEERKYQNAGNKESQDFYLGGLILFGNKNEVKKLRVQDVHGRVKEVRMPMYKQFKGDFLNDRYIVGMFSQNHRQFLRMITKDIGYADFTSWRDEQASGDSLIGMGKKCKGLIIDIRGFPNFQHDFISEWLEGITQKIRPEITDKVSGDLPEVVPHIDPFWGGSSRMGNILNQKSEGVTMTARKINVPVKFVVLTNGSAQSYAESLTLTFKSECNAMIVGSPTAGAASYFVNYLIPGQLRLWLSGDAIKRSGYQPDLFIRPTVKGFQLGKDEVLERAIKYLQTGK